MIDWRKYGVYEIVLIIDVEEEGDVKIRNFLRDD